MFGRDTADKSFGAVPGTMEHLDPNCRGVFFGLSAMHKRDHLIRAVLEGVAYSQLDCVEVFREMGVPVNDMTVTSGGGRSPLWRSIIP